MRVPNSHPLVDLGLHARRTTSERARRRADLQRTSLHTAMGQHLRVSPKEINRCAFRHRLGIRAPQPCLLPLGPPFILLGLGLMCERGGAYVTKLLVFTAGKGFESVLSRCTVIEPS